MSANDKSSPGERPEIRAYKELELLVRSLGEELAMFRRRALAAEAQLKEAGQAPPKGKSAISGERLAELQDEIEGLRTRLARAEERVKQVMDRVRFLRQQIQSQSTASAVR
jgi:predicted  nucleic acid-binding Zn-ribbon protein